VSTLKEQLRSDLTAAMKARNELEKATLRMTLTAIGNAEVAGSEARELDDAEVLKVISKEAKKRAESAAAFAEAGREELAAQERAEGEVLARYLPTQLGDDELDAIAREAVEQTATELGEQPGPRQMGQVMKRAQAAAAGRAEGGRVAAAVKKLLTPGGGRAWIRVLEHPYPRTGGGAAAATWPAPSSCAGPTSSSGPGPWRAVRPAARSPGRR
jgi:uncharacterized protein YqeY